MKSIFSACLLCFFVSGVMAQTNVKDFFYSQTSPSVYLGIDFTKAKLINDPAGNPQTMVGSVFSAINTLVITEVKKFQLNEAFHKTNLEHDFTGVDKRNGAIDPGKLASTNPADDKRFTADSIKDIVQHFDFNGKTGVGVLFVMEAMDKGNKVSYIWVTLIDLQTKNVILTERIEGKTGMAFGERNYWANGVKEVIDEVKNHAWKKWAKQYGS